MVERDGAVDPLTILHVTAPARVGGLERVVETLASGHVKAGHHVHVVTVGSDAAELRSFSESLEACAVAVHPIVVSSRAYRRERSTLRALCSTIAPTVVHTHGYRSDVLASGVARRLGIPTVSTVHGFTRGGFKNQLYEAIQVWALAHRFHAVIAVSQALADELLRRGVPHDRLRVIPNVWDPSRVPLDRERARKKLGLSAGAVSIGWVGRITREKGADVLLRAASELPDGTTVSFIGDGAERSRLEAMAAAMGLASRVRWHGLLQDAGTLISAFDVFVLSSRTEGTPIVLFEAMASGVPIVATAVGGVPNVVSSAEAFLIPPENPSALTAAIIELLSNPDVARRRAESAKRRVETQFSLERWLKEYEALYRALASAP